MRGAPFFYTRPMLGAGAKGFYDFPGAPARRDGCASGMSFALQIAQSTRNAKIPPVFRKDCRLSKYPIKPSGDVMKGPQPLHIQSAVAACTPRGRDPSGRFLYHFLAVTGGDNGGRAFARLATKKNDATQENEAFIFLTACRLFQHAETPCFQEGLNGANPIAQVLLREQIAQNVPAHIQLMGGHPIAELLVMLDKNQRGRTVTEHFFHLLAGFQIQII